jgi:hypothetical protein
LTIYISTITNENLASLELAIREFLARFSSRVLVLILPIINHFSAAIEQQHLFTLSNPCLTLKRRLELFPSILSGPEEVFGYWAAVATAEYLVNRNCNVLIEPKKVESIVSFFGSDVFSSFKSSKAGSGRARGVFNLSLLSL